MITPDELRKFRLNLGHGRWKMASLLGIDKMIYCKYEDGKYRIPWKFSNQALMYFENNPKIRRGDYFPPNGRISSLRDIPIGFTKTVKVDEIPRYRKCAEKLTNQYQFKMKRLKNGYGIIKRVQ